MVGEIAGFVRYTMRRQMRLVCTTWTIGVSHLALCRTPARIGDLVEVDNREALKFVYKHGADIHECADGAFRWACKDGQLSLAMWLREQGAELHAREDEAFLYACKDGDLALVMWLAREGVDISSVGADGLYLAYSCGHLEVAKWLCFQGVDVAIVDTGGLSLAKSRKYGTTGFRCSVRMLEWIRSQGIPVSDKTLRHLRRLELQETRVHPCWVLSVGVVVVVGLFFVFFPR